MKIFNSPAWIRIGAALVTFALTACATPSTTPPRNPWASPDREYNFSSQETNADLNALMQPCIDHARETFPEAAVRFDAGLPPETLFVVVAFSDYGTTEYVFVDATDATQINGLMYRDSRVNGRRYDRGDRISLDITDVVDWLIQYPDRPEEGNLTGKYMLLRQDGLAHGACNPQDSEFQHFRFFAWEYSFVPPGVEGWEADGQTNDADMSMQEKGDSPNELNTLYANGYSAPAFATDQEFIDKIIEVEKKNLGDPARYTLFEHRVAAYTEHETRCVRSHQVIEDNQALLSKSGERGPMTREILSLACVHPRMNTMVVGITYSHRYQPGHRDPAFTEKADTVFKSLAFKIRN